MRQDALRWWIIAPHTKNRSKPPHPEWPYWPHQVNWDEMYEEMKLRDNV